MWIAEDRALVGDYGSGQALSDDRYRLLEPFIPPARPGGRPRTTDIRRLLDGLFYVVRTGCQWRHLPPPSLPAVAHGVGHMPVEIPVPYPSLGLRGARGFDLEEGMVISLDCLYFGAELGPCHMENVFIINAGGAESTYATPLEIMGPR